MEITKYIFKDNLIKHWIVIVGILILGAIIYANPSCLAYFTNNRNNTKNIILSSQEAGDKIILKVGEEEFDSYISKNGKLFFPQFIDINEIENLSQNKSLQEVPKADIPDVKIFVMSYCPFGIQAQKMFLPVYDLLKNKAKIGIYFVDYIMHDKIEIDENLTQYCIQANQTEKYSDYLNCFLKDGDSEKCILDSKIDKEKLISCVSEIDAQYKITEQYNNKDTWLNKQFPKFDVHADINKEYGIQGSPTIVINNQIIEVNPRSPEHFKNIICSAFNSKPEECSQTLSENAFAPGFGIGESSTSEGQCK